MGCSGLSCTNRDSIAIFPRVSWDFGCVSPPTDFTDQHRWLVALILPRNSRICTDGLVASVLPRNSQKFCCISPPTDFTDLHRWLGCVCSPTEFTEVLLRRSSHGIHGIHRSLVASVLPQNSRNSQKFCCVAFFYKLRECSVGGASLPEGSVCSVRSVGGVSLPEGSVCSVRSVGDIPACFVGAVLALTGGKAELRQLDS